MSEQGVEKPALGCGKSNETVLTFCTCDRDRVIKDDFPENLRIKNLCERVTRLEKEMEGLRALIKIEQNKFFS